MSNTEISSTNLAFSEFMEKSCVELAKEVPEFPTQMGMFEISGEPVPQSYFAAIDAGSRAARRDLLQRIANDLQQFPRERLNASNLLSADIFGFFLDYAHERGLVGRKGAALQQNEYLIRPSVGLQSELPLFLTDLHPMRHDGDAGDYVSRLRCIAPQLREATRQLREQQSSGSGPPALVIRNVVDEVQRFVAAPPIKNTLYETLDSKTPGLSNLTDSHRQSLLKDTVEELERNVYPVYEDLLDTMREMEPTAAETPGVWRLPEGDAWYDFQLRAATTTTLSADEIHELGLDETDRLEHEIVSACGDLGIEADSIVDCHRQLDARNDRLQEDTKENRRAIVNRVEALIADIEPHLPDLFHTLPKGKVVVKPIPEFAEANRNHSYQPPSLDGSRPGIFELNVGQLLGESNYELPILVYHEIFPGHHLQISLAQETENLPSLRRIVTFDAYIEGWAKYAELMPSMHGLSNDPYLRIARMRRELISTINLALDTGIHAKRWSERDAMSFFARHSGMNETFCRYIVHRSAAVPAQLCAYKIGMLKMMQMRRRMESAMGASFDVKEFHDIVLREGAVPLTVLERLVDAEIARRRKN